MIDTHCHLTASQFDGDRAEVLGQAHRAGVTTIVNPGTDLEQSYAAVELAEHEPSVRAAIGVHPQDISTLSEDVWNELERVAGHPRVVAIGEVGVEHSSRAPSMKQQEDALRRFLDLAGRAKKPLIFHVRDAHPEFRKFLGEHTTPSLHGVMHCFSGSWDDAQAYLARGLYISVTGIVTFPNAESLREVVRQVPLDRLLLETDSPFLAPQSHRGQRNQPAFVVDVAREVARLHGKSVEDIADVTDANARRLFGIS